MESLYHALDRLLESLDARAVPYALIGGIAVRAHAIPRNTNDIDVVVLIDQSARWEFFQDLVTRGFEVPEPYLRGWIDRVTGMSVAKVKVYLARRGIDIDLFLAESPFQRSLIERRLPVDIDGRTVWIATAEDLVLLKLLASRPRDTLDVADVLYISGQLDVSYLRQWASDLGILPQLEQALSESGQV
jgi:predicted nucleotidyltransferase